MIKELTHIADLAAQLREEAQVYVVYDRNVAWVVRDLPWPSLGIETSETRKTLETVQEIGRFLLEAGASRQALVLAVGGGVTTDMAGFAAAIYKRGIRYANLPTTLLAQVDAAIGGKTGVNLDAYKNMLGAFHMPECTFLCAEVLKTLPRREFLSGLAEMLKTFLLADGSLYGEAVRFFAAAQKERGPYTKTAPLVQGLEPLMAKAAAIKAQIVAEDPLEHGVRAKLNLGHSFGHAIEHAARLHGADITHGEAVSMGIILAARLGEQLGLSDKGLAGRLASDFSAIGLPASCPYPLEALQEAMAKDKKALGGGMVKFVIPLRPGEVVFHELNPYDLHIDTK